MGQLGIKKAAATYRFVKIQRLAPPVNEKPAGGMRAAAAVDSGPRWGMVSFWISRNNRAA